MVPHLGFVANAVLTALAMAEKCLHSVSTFSFLDSIPNSASKLGVAKELGGGTADSDWPQGHPISCSVMLGNKTGARG